MTDIERIARVLHLKENKSKNTNLCLIIQGEIKKLISNNNKLTFTNIILKQQNQKLRDKIENNIKQNKINKDNENNKINKDRTNLDTYKNVRKKLEEVNRENYILNSENEYLNKRIKILKKKLKL